MSNEYNQELNDTSPTYIVIRESTCITCNGQGTTPCGSCGGTCNRSTNDGSITYTSCGGVGYVTYRGCGGRG